jgi:hypothetical protein
MLSSRTLGATLAVLALTGAAILPASAQSATFNFDADTAGTTTAFTDTNNGFAATFDSTAGGGAFMVQDSFFQNQSGNDLGAVVGANSIPLDITFSKSLSSLALNFGLNGPTNSTFTVTAFSGGLSGTRVGSATASATIPGGIYLFPEGSVTFAGASFDTVELTSTAQNIFVDNIVVSAPVPEASSGAGLGLLLALGLGGAAWQARKRRALS